MVTVINAPYNSTIGIRQKEDGKLVLHSASGIQNFFGVIHPCALISLAEAASGQFLIDRLDVDVASMLPVIKSVVVEMGKPAKERAIAECTLEGTIEDQFKEEMIKRGRSRVKTVATVKNEDDREALRAVIEWLVMKNATRSAR